MEFLTKKGIIIYLLILFAHCFFIFFELDEWRFFSKLVLVPFLMLLYVLQFSGHKNSKSFLLPILALIGSFAGDLLLAFKGPQFFLFGMLGFMITHISNGIYFYSLKSLSFKQSKFARFVILILIISCSLVVYIIKENAGAFFIPIVVYMLLIAIMTLLSANLAESNEYNSVAVHYFIPGAVLFVLSDGLLAINKFNLHDPSMDIFVMVTYGLAQLYLVMGYYKTNAEVKTKS